MFYITCILPKDDLKKRNQTGLPVIFYLEITAYTAYSGDHSDDSL